MGYATELLVQGLRETRPGRVTMPDCLRLRLTLNVTAGPIAGSVRCPGGTEVSFGGWIGLLAAVHALLDRKVGHGDQQGDVAWGQELLVQERARHVRASDGGAPRCLREPQAGEDLGGLRSVPDDIEALVAHGRYAEAQARLALFDERARAMSSSWALLAVGRCRGALAAARGDLAGAIAALEGMLRAHERCDEPFERARALLALGRVQRRAKQWAQAREALAEALQLFEQAGPPGWAEMARGEIARCGLRAAEGELTPSEQRVAELVAQGLSNRETAAAAFISPKTVEANLARIYRKLGIRSRAQLGAHIATHALGAAGKPVAKEYAIRA
jgi:DNA-binding CsgD family transcriptional regulator